MLKLLPTRDYEYFNVADMLGMVTSILGCHSRYINCSADQKESVSNLIDMMGRLIDALKYHLMPYLEETGVSGMEDTGR